MYHTYRICITAVFETFLQNHPAPLRTYFWETEMQTLLRTYRCSRYCCNSVCGHKHDLHCWQQENDQLNFIVVRRTRTYNIVWEAFTIVRLRERRRILQQAVLLLLYVELYALTPCTAVCACLCLLFRWLSALLGIYWFLDWWDRSLVRSKKSHFLSLQQLSVVAHIK